jgi:hypothetical protein
LLLSCCWTGWTSLRAGADAYRIDRAEYTLSRADVPPQDTHWQEVDVPASFAVAMAPFVSVWYRVPVTIPPAQLPGRRVTDSGCYAE